MDSDQALLEEQVLEEQVAQDAHRGVVSRRAVRRLAKLLTFVVSLTLFVFGILLMKDGAQSLAPLIKARLQLNDPLTAFSAGWLASMITLSGSPVAAASLTFLEVGVLTPISAFTMIMGSRFGASFVVLTIGFVYSLRGRDLLTSLGMGLLSFGVTISLHIIGIVPGIWFLQSGILHALRAPRPSGGRVSAGVDTLFTPATDILTRMIPEWSLFLVGFGVILLSFALFDRCLPTASLKQSQVGAVARYVYRPSVMFTLGVAVTLIAMSVSLSISILVPLSDRALVRRENVTPYIMGANVSTFIDTLLASLLMTTPFAFEVVLAEMVSVALAALLILIFFIRQYEHVMEIFVTWVTTRPRNLLIFLFLLFSIPITGFLL